MSGLLNKGIKLAAIVGVGYLAYEMYKKSQMSGLGAVTRLPAGVERRRRLREYGLKLGMRRKSRRICRHNPDHPLCSSNVPPASTQPVNPYDWYAFARQEAIKDGVSRMEAR